MTDTTLKTKSLRGFVWSSADKIGQQLLYVVLGVVMARLLSSTDYGLVGVLSLFTVMAGVLQESGFSQALIRNVKAHDDDYSSVFWLNLSISFILYGILYFMAPFLAYYFDLPQLTSVARVLFLAFVFNALGIVQHTRLTKHFRFHTLALINTVALVVSGIPAIWIAYIGGGAWALVMQIAGTAFVKMILLWCMGRWLPRLVMDRARLGAMFGFSFRILLTNVINNASANLYPTLIGRFFPVAQVGYYAQATKWQVLPADTIATPLQNIAMPLLSQLHSDTERRHRVFRKLMRLTAFLSFPAIVGFAFVSHELVVLALGEKWLPSVVLLQILSVATLFYPLQYLMSTGIKAMGNSKTVLRLEIIRNGFVLLNLFVTLRYGVQALAMGFVIVNVLSFLGYLAMSKRMFSYCWKEIFSDLSPFVWGTLLGVLSAFFVTRNIQIMWVAMVCKIAIVSVIYLLWLKMRYPEIIDDAIAFIKKPKE